MVSQIWSIVFLLTSINIASMRVTEAWIQEEVLPEGMFRKGLEWLAVNGGFQTAVPILVSLGDGVYSEAVVPWSKRAKHVGLHQQVIVACDDAMVSAVQKNGIFALRLDGTPVATSSATVLTSNWQENMTIPVDTTVIKFLVPALLLEAGFEKVVFADMDVYFWRSPFGIKATAETWLDEIPSLPREEANLVAMRNGGRIDLNPVINIGFMIFQNRSIVPFLREFLQLWSRDEHKTQRVHDQDVFSNLVHQREREMRHAVDKTILNDVKISLLPADYFADMAQAVQPKTAVWHVTWMDDDCKVFFFKKLFGGAGPEAIQLVVHELVQSGNHTGGWHGKMLDRCAELK